MSGTFMNLSDFGLTMGVPPHHHHGGGGRRGGGGWGGPWYPQPYIDPLIIQTVETEEERKKRLAREEKLKKEQAAIQVAGYGDFLTAEALKDATVHLGNFRHDGRSMSLDAAMKTMADFLTVEALKNATVRFGPPYVVGSGVDQSQFSGLGDSVPSTADASVAAAAAAAAASIASRTARVTVNYADGTPYNGPVSVAKIDGGQIVLVDTIKAANGVVEYLIPVDDALLYVFNVQEDTTQKGNSVPANPGGTASMTLERVDGKGSFPVLPVLGAAILGFLALKK